MNRRDFLKKVGLATAAAGASATCAVVADTPVTGERVVTVEKVVEKIVEKQVPAEVVTLQQFEDATYAYENRLLPLSEYRRITDLFIRTTFVAQAADVARHPVKMENIGDATKRRVARRRRKAYGA